MTNAHLDAGSKGGGGIVVYVVEDDESVRSGFVRLLRAANVELRERALVMPLIAVSVRDDEPVRRQARILGAKMFLRKPVDGQALVDVIEWVTSALI